MKIHECEQRTPIWDKHRSGKITASVASKLVTPTGKFSSQIRGEVGRIIAEARGLQDPVFLKPTYWMERGVNMEAEARGWFSVETGLVTREVGFIEHDTGLAGFSPDSIIECDDGIIPVELKVPKPSTHIDWLCEWIESRSIPSQHLPQCHFALAVTDAPYMYFMSYSPDVPCILEKVERGKMTDTVTEALDNFYDLFDRQWVAVTGEPYFKSNGDN